MKDKQVKKLIMSALFAALCCGATMVITLPVGNGYVNAGDAVVLIGAFVLGPVWGALAAGLGSGLADLLVGYALYVPGTVVIKAVSALLAGLLLNTIGLRKPNPAAVLAAVLAELWMTAGYFLYEYFFLGFGFAAVAGVPANLVQGAVGAAGGAALFGALCKSTYFLRLFDVDKRS